MRTPSQNMLARLYCRRAWFSSTITANSGKFRIINSSQITESADEAAQLNSKREAQLQEYQSALQERRKEYAQYAQSIPTKAEREATIKAQKSQKRSEMWEKYVAGVKKRLNPNVEELQTAGLIPRPNPERKAEKAQRGIEALAQAHRQAILMRRKYLSYLATEVIPDLVNEDNLDAKIQSALDNPVSYNLTVDSVVRSEKQVKERLRSIRVEMEEELNNKSPLPQLQ